MTDSPGNLSVIGQPRYEHVRKLLLKDFPPPADVVELGSAPGDQIAALGSLGYRATSVDLGAAEDGWGSGEEGRFQRLLRAAGVTHVSWNLEDVPFPLADASFDAVLLTEVFEHLREYPLRCLQEAKRILRPGGRLYLTTPNAAYLVRRLRLLRGHTVHSPLHDWLWGMPHARHAREYTFAEIGEVISLAGLRVVTRESRHFHIDDGRGGALSRGVKLGLDRLARVRPALGPSIIVVAERP